MKVGDKEFYELQQQFEKDIVKESCIFGCSVEREEKGSPVGYFYTDGTINKMFNAYMMGYEYSKCLHR